MSQETISNEAFNRRINIVIAIMVAITAVLSTFITKLENQASTESSKAGVAEQQYYYQAIGTQLSGETDVHHAFGTVYQLWYQYEVQRLSSQKRGETEAAATFTELRDSIAKTSTLFEPQYFDSATGSVNMLLYEADTYRKELYRLEEKQSVANQLSTAWDKKSSQHSLQLTLLAVAGFLFGLALMTKGKIPTLVFTDSGIAMVVVISVWAYQVSIAPIVERPADAIANFAEGASLVDQRKWEQAANLLTKAIEASGAEQRYGRAYLLRARANSALGNFEEAIADYRVGIASGYSGDPTVQASLVQAYFSIGDFKNAIQTGNEAIKQSPDNLALQQQIAIATLAGGYISEASQQTTQMLENAAEQADQQRQIGDQQAVTQITWFLNDAAHQYKQLSSLLQSTKESPIRKNINDPISVRKAAAKLAGQIQANTLAIKNNIDATMVSAPNPGTRIDIQSITPSKTPDQKYIYKVDIELAYSEIEASQLLSIITYRNGIEESSWNFSQAWTASQKNGTATFTLSPSYSSLYIVPTGLYTIQIYLDTDLLANGEFLVAGPGELIEASPDDGYALDSLLDQLEVYTGYYSYDLSYEDTGNYDWYFYDPFFFYDEESYYLYFLEQSYDFYSAYCTDTSDLSCVTINDSDGDGVPDDLDYCPIDPGPFENSGCPVTTDDADGDGIPNESDVCPYTFGSEDTIGCPAQETDPDSDGDGYSDTLDLCPFEPGSTANDGCPVTDDDADGDGITNESDLCPYAVGTENNNGCPADGAEPDLDGDGVPDTIDFCTNEPGPADYNGCPDGGSPVDSDGDGILDTDDLCPAEPGLAENGGCMATSASDFDGDGIADSDDACPYDPGSSQNSGCPEVASDPDTDGDGISDSSDSCPFESGSPENGGCPGSSSNPDSDGDGLLDSEDYCPNEAGPAENYGCP